MSRSQTHPRSKSGPSGRAESGAKKNTSRKIEVRREAAPASTRIVITADERHRLISEAAYYRAMHRGFHGGADLEDWLESEAEIDRLIWHR